MQGASNDDHGAGDEVSGSVGGVSQDQGSVPSW